MTYNVLVVKGY